MFARAKAPSLLKVIVIGAGAIGGWVGARLANAGHDVELLVRRGRASDFGGRLVLIDGVEELKVPVGVTEDPSGMTAPDLLVVAVKAFSLASVAPAVESIIGPDTVVLPLMNGVPWWFTDEPLQSVDPGAKIAAAIPRKAVVGAVVHAACRRDDGGQIVTQMVDHLLFGGLDGDDPRAAALAKQFTEAGIQARVRSDIRAAIWYKLWGNMTINPLSALTLATADRLVEQCREIILPAMEEARAIGAAIGYPIAESGEDRLAVTKRLGAFKTSMLQDVEVGRPLELDALLGAPLELARRHSIPAPTLATIERLTRVMAESRGLLP